MAADDAPPTLVGFPDVLADPAVERRRSEISARLFGTEEQPQRVGRYRLGRRLGSGAIGVVHLAHDDLLDRDVALKLLRTYGDADTRRALREAQALARLAHPNVVSVFAAGIDAGHAFIAMELVMGSTLRAWQADRSWREIVATYVQAGRGLAAAHEAGIVHRDFKPDNAMIGPDGRVRVLDFGLARGLAAPLEEVAGSTASHEIVRSVSAAGALVGTPAYMAPEQLSGVDADARSDQFAFCVAVFEALWGERPFAGTTPAALLERELAEQVRPRPPGSPVPLRIHDVLCRGLRAERDARWPAMEDCLEALQRAARRFPARLVWGGALVGAATLGAAMLLRVDDATADCSGARERLAGIWDDARRTELEAAFGTAITKGASEWSGASARLDAYADEWVDVWTQTCRESEGEAAVERMRCLARRRDALAATIEGLIAANPMNARSAALLGELEPIEPCLDANRFEPSLELPADPERAAAVQAVERRMVGAHAQVVAGNLDRGLREYETAVADARALDWPPLLAEALYWAGAAASEAERSEAAREFYEEGYAVALASRRDDVAASAAAHLITLVGYERSEFDEAARWARLGQAAIDRVGRPSRIEADIFNNLGLVAMNRGEHAEAREYYRRSIEIYEAVGADTSLSTPIQNSAELAYLAGDYEEADRLLGNAIELEASGGADRPDLLSLLMNRAIVRTNVGRLDEAEADLQRALSIAERALGPDSQSSANVFSNLAAVAAAREDWEAALAHYRRALDVYARGIGRDNERAIRSQAGAGLALVRLGRVDEGDALLVQSLVEMESVFGPDHEDVAVVELDLGGSRVSAGRAAEALLPLQRAAEIFTRTDGPNSLRVTRARAARGQALLDLGRIDEAIDELEWALSVLQTYTLPPQEMAELRFALARALKARAPRIAAALRQHDAERSETLSRSAAIGFRDAGSSHAKQLAEVERFLAR